VYGRVFCFFYAMIGVPLTMIAIANMGKYMSNAIQWCEEKVTQAWRKLRMKLRTEQSELSEYEDEPRIRLSGEWLFLTTVVYILLGSALIASWESWDFFTAVYFNFFSITTIGFGDYWPRK
jgi:hypothetical protein